MMAIPSSLNPMLAINLPLALESPRGMNPAADALRVTLLGIGAVHQAFLLARSGMNTVQTTATFQYAANLRDMAKQMVCRALDDPAAAASDAALSAATSLATIDIFFGGEHWLDNFAVAKRLVAQRGGPARMLKASTPTQLADGVTATPARLLLEMLAIYETLGEFILESAKMPHSPSVVMCLVTLRHPACAFLPKTTSLTRLYDELHCTLVRVCLCWSVAS